ncbi:hypothetical protein M2282_004048 [Variovorax boronicumulans]|uniref:hypothetical protein n=1 Tax=Variovorax boronicumulans TaxID=436515 RepID=UPI0024731845|nr:hypothetical protein [Variovorax boronicumulans]MDH6168884.1 hypothetical protein [Variovorax boronicumulans]
MPRLHPSVALIAHLSAQTPGYGCVSPDGRYQAVEVGGDTLIVDVLAQQMHRAPGVYPRGFDDATPDGAQGIVLRVEGEETATAYLPAWTDLQWIPLENAAADFWSPWPDPREAGLPPLAEVLPAEWTSDAPQATERVRKSIGEWVAWLVALAVLGFFALFGFQAITWATAGGWQWLWMAVGLPVFAMFSVLTVVFVVTTWRERRRVRVALGGMSLARGEGFRVGEPLELRLLAEVPEAQGSERTEAPERIAMRLMRRSVRSDAEGRWTVVDECCDEAVAMRDDTTRLGRVLYACEVRAESARAPTDDPATQWFVALHDTAAPDSPAFMVAGLRLLAAR